MLTVSGPQEGLSIHIQKANLAELADGWGVLFFGD